MKVRATKTGFFNNKRVYEGDVFEVSDALFSKRWMEKATEKAESPKQAHKPSDKDKAVI